MDFDNIDENTDGRAGRQTDPDVLAATAATAATAVAASWRAIAATVRPVR